jgi:hypothetical protein
MRYRLNTHIPKVEPTEPMVPTYAIRLLLNPIGSMPGMIPPGQPGGAKGR